MKHININGMDEKDTTLVRERSGVQISAAAPPIPLIYWTKTDGLCFKAQAEPSKNTRHDVARNWQGDFSSLCCYQNPHWLEYRDPDPTAVYRYYSEDGTLLYVGISNSPQRRNEQHKLKRWHNSAHWIVVDCYPWRQMAEVVESIAIEVEAPPNNFQHRYNRYLNAKRCRRFFEETGGALVGKLSYAATVDDDGNLNLQDC